MDRVVLCIAAGLLSLWGAGRARATLPDHVEPWCRRVYEHHCVPAAATGVPPSSAAFHVDPILLEEDRLRLQVEVAIGADAQGLLRAAACASVPSLVWEGSVDHIAQVSVDIEELPRLAVLAGIERIRRPPVGLPLVTSQGVAEVGADRFHDMGYTGEGVVVGVLDVGFAGARNLVGIELPADTRMRSFTEYGLDGQPSSVHGTACAEIVHDIAPGAQLLLANARTLTEMNAAIRWLRDEGAMIISHSVGWFEGPGDGTGTISSLVGQAIDSDVLWVNAVGNEATAYYGGWFSDEDGDGRHEFDASGDATLTETGVRANTSFSFILVWDRWPESPDLTFELEVYINDVFRGSSELCCPETYPIREIVVTTSQNQSTVDLVIRRTQGTEDVRLRLFRLDGDLAEHATPSGSVLLPADSPRVLSVGAYRRRGGEASLEDFSSRGPTLAGLAKPELCALDNVDTQSYAEGFVGTSAACPLAAGAVALLYEAIPPAGFFDFRWEREELWDLLAWAAEPDRFDDPDATVWGLLHLPVEEEASRSKSARIRVLSPSRLPVRAEIEPAARGPFSLRVLDPQGRLLAMRTYGPGAHGRFTWDGRGPSGHPVPSGIYLLSVRSRTGSASRSFFLVR